MNIYQTDAGEFDERGFSKVQFMNLFELGKRREFSNKSLITKRSKYMDKL
jgi:hypothetical protein